MGTLFNQNLIRKRFVLKNGFWIDSQKFVSLLHSENPIMHNITGDICFLTAVHADIYRLALIAVHHIKVFCIEIIPSSTDIYVCLAEGAVTARCRTDTISFATILANCCAC